ncbi:hypothetical protein TBLA_0J01610 [Henningerozyma blattae CBS 6284]|uniref:Uncharacterized protein n=1 Tax=Henningerozyma blattae (strain ATCC 34711 / CBS 6284 / DSM 70876 / NBRC 10599 / NRRL Y-10934 / UCD 77-7) TaxID=1071380 RepID=I2H9V4_HENB6|nr:hypothetical protein TBLA_0J01610 [Tetrapisispora blattae CBS 6284]CCH63156.1 hypothetical protein TBLA_0J01610 [Tetrapisispora blattae CBS 6284]
MASCIGAAQGALFGITSGFLLKRYNKLYRNARFQVHVLYQCFCVAYTGAFKGDKQLISFQERYFQQENEKRKLLINKAADQGIFLEDDATIMSTIDT